MVCEVRLFGIGLSGSRGHFFSCVDDPISLTLMLCVHLKSTDEIFWLIWFKIYVNGVLSLVNEYSKIG